MRGGELAPDLGSSALPVLSNKIHCWKKALPQCLRASPTWSKRLLERKGIHACSTLLGRLRRLMPRVAIIDVDQFNRRASHILDRLRQLAHLSPILLRCRCDLQSQQMAQRVHCCMDLTPFAALRSIIACSVSTF